MTCNPKEKMMKICVLGGTGFIGSHIVSTLIAENHQVVIGCRDTERAKMIFPDAQCFKIIAGISSPQQFVEALQGCDAVINTIGVLGKPGTTLANDAHIQLIETLIAACKQTNINRIVHISALSLEENITSEYADTKLKGEQLLCQSNIESIILRASFVYSTGSYGGSSALRGLCAMPFAALLPNGGKQKFQPLWAFDLAKIALKACTSSLPAEQNYQILSIAGPETLSFANILQKTRRWLGINPCKIISMPLIGAKIMGKIGDYFPLWGFSTAVVSQLNTDFIIPEEQKNSLGINMRSMDKVYQTHPSFVQDRWHSKLFLARPLLALFLAVIWLGSAIAGFMTTPEYLRTILPQFIASSPFSLYLVYLFSIIDVYFAVKILLGKWSNKLWLSQLALVILYTVGLTIVSPALWFDLFGSLLKNIAVIGLIGVMLSIANDR
ncbi:Nucleoside-diphosphate-sugar epimerase (WcaG) (PDB:2X4G) [Commensalibacter communis]|nr:Nucleoside-diphosphate-sugar epimerase (WcaG) (PDB:2X4G) [Commensalibacter communis]CAI3942074.1 Nucleoside-diphosphate-sugar epimerase (WcaG) (PDB:2X4G) [Commensalibacter communis]